jgi:hypothetical protein
MPMIFARRARQWISLQPRVNIGVRICGACGSLEARFLPRRARDGGDRRSTGRRVSPGHVPFSCSIDGHASSGDAAALVMKLQQGGNL